MRLDNPPIIAARQFLMSAHRVCLERRNHQDPAQHNPRAKMVSECKALQVLSNHARAPLYFQEARSWRKVESNPVQHMERPAKDASP